ncbi:hypothetical protein [Pacificoceanicola onchidii]|uniref:hypothetical protein n=1 Tax=Pacificoceanicola onchidii TaxID=2562685 RepID=UPI0010A689C4|nr:hypothetical protein [Pacificoceanicola onchidii]
MPGRTPKRRKRVRRRKGLAPRLRRSFAIALTGAGWLIRALCAGAVFALHQVQDFAKGFRQGWADVSPRKTGDTHDP